jgi:hypothetical protein
MARNYAQLSSPCQQTLGEVQRRASALGADCNLDIQRYCPGTPVGGGRILQCLGAEVGRGELSSNCEDSVTGALEKLDAFTAGCSDDAAALCPGVASGRGRLFACLRSQQERLSSRCQQALSK